MECSRTVGLVLGLLLTAGSAATQEPDERPPTDVETLDPITVQRSAAEDRVGTSAVTLNRVREIPLMTPVGPAGSGEYRAVKAEVAGDPQVQEADQMLGPSGPTAQVAASVTTAFRGINVFEAGTILRNGDFVASVPPDPQVAASPTRVVELVNNAIRMRRRGGALVQTLDLNDFFGAPRPETFFDVLFDPKVIYDPNGKNKRFYAVALQTRRGAEPPNFSYIWLAVSRSANPANLNPANWCFYRINARRNAGTELDSWADYPGLGAGPDALVITANQFTFEGGFFTFNIVRALNKQVLSNNAGSCPKGARVFSFQTIDFTVQPVQHLTDPSSFPGTRNPTYLVSNTFFAGKDYQVYRLRNIATSPTLSRTTVTGDFRYLIQPDVEPYPNEDGFLSTGDNRMMEAAGVGNAFWATHATACSFPRGGNVSCTLVVRITVDQAPGGGVRGRVTQQKVFGNPNEFLFWPGIAVNLDETVAVPFHFVSPGRTNNNLSTWWTIKALGEGSFGPLRPLATGVCKQVTIRTGDYAGAETDPVDLRSFWLSGERARRIPEFDACLWETRIIRVRPGTTAAGARIAAGRGSPD